MKEQEIINCINRGDLSAFQHLYTLYYSALCVYALKFTRNKEIAEEVVQDVFLKLWEQQGRLISIGSLKSYLFVTVRNQCLDHLKHLQVVRNFNTFYTQLLKEAEDLYIFSQESGDAMMIASELEKSVNDAIEALPDQCRKIFKMSRFDHLKNQEIAEKLGITLNTVQRQISIALEKLRSALSKYLLLIILFLNFFTSGF
jgi:RNA polymerase sigma-70 factor (ECF subfamily)